MALKFSSELPLLTIEGGENWYGDGVWHGVEDFSSEVVGRGAHLFPRIHSTNNTFLSTCKMPLPRTHLPHSHSALTSRYQRYHQKPPRTAIFCERLRNIGPSTFSIPMTSDTKDTTGTLLRSRIHAQHPKYPYTPLTSPLLNFNICRKVSESPRTSNHIPSQNPQVPTTNSYRPNMKWV